MCRCYEDISEGELTRQERRWLKEKRSIRWIILLWQRRASIKKGSTFCLYYLLSETQVPLTSFSEARATKHLHGLIYGIGPRFASTKINDETTARYRLILLSCFFYISRLFLSLNKHTKNDGLSHYCSYEHWRYVWLKKRYLMNAVKEIQENACEELDRCPVIEVEIQRASGAFSMYFVDAFINRQVFEIWWWSTMSSHTKQQLFTPSANKQISYSSNSDYTNVTNVVVRLRDGRQKDDLTRKDALLINAHYDSPFGSVGAGDDGAAVACVLESIRALSGRHTNTTPTINQHIHISLTPI